MEAPTTNQRETNHSAGSYVTGRPKWSDCIRQQLCVIVLNWLHGNLSLLMAKKIAPPPKKNPRLAKFNITTITTNNSGFQLRRTVHFSYFNICILCKYTWADSVVLIFNNNTITLLIFFFSNATICLRVVLPILSSASDQLARGSSICIYRKSMYI